MEKSDKEDRIVGGEEASITNYPYQVFMIMYRGNSTYQCGGSIISELHILTAAHCIDRIDYIDVRVGSSAPFEGGTVYRSGQLISHPNYDRRTFENDIAIVWLTQYMSLDGINATKIRIARRRYYPANNTEMDISGWGADREGGATPTATLRATRINVQSITLCQSLFGETLVTNRSFCAGPLEGGKDTCQGDSGGPGRQVSNGIQIGIVSNGFGCARPNSPGIYTNVGSFYSWIVLMTGGFVN